MSEFDEVKRKGKRLSTATPEKSEMIYTRQSQRYAGFISSPRAAPAMAVSTTRAASADIAEQLTGACIEYMGLNILNIVMPIFDLLFTERENV